VIAKEGSLPVIITAAVALVVARAAGAVWSVPVWLLVAFLLYLFRFRHRPVTTLPLAIVSPADGRVDRVESGFDPWFGREALRIGIRLCAPGISVLRSPVAGKVASYRTDLEPPDGASGEPGLLDSPTRYALWLETDTGDEIVYMISSTWRHSRYRADVAPGERAGKGQRAGFVYFASRVDVLAPRGTRPEVDVGQRVAGGTAIIATLIH